MSRRVGVLQGHLTPTGDFLPLSAVAVAGSSAATVAAPVVSEGTVTIKDNRSGKSVTVPVDSGTIHATELQKLSLRSYDPGLVNTAVCRSKVTFIDGEKGILWYRGYPIEELAEKSTFLEVAFLLINGELPDASQLREWEGKIMSHTYLHENMIQLLHSFRYDSHPYGLFVSAIAALNTFYPGANTALRGSDLYRSNEQLRNKQIYRILGKLPTIAAYAYRNRIGRPFVPPVSDGSLSYTENFLMMMDRLSENSYKPDPRISKAIDVLFILHADHELNCSTAAMRHLSSSRADPYTCIAGAAGALYGPLHGGASEQVVRMLESIGSVDKVPQFLEDVKNKKRLLFGFGHRVYRTFDPRASIVRKLAYSVFEVVGKDPLIQVAEVLEKTALSEEYFKSRSLYPNVDFYSGILERSLGFPTDFFTVLFALGRTAGWLAHWVESCDLPDNIFRPRQVYDGPDMRHYVAVEARPHAQVRPIECPTSSVRKRRDAGVKFMQSERRLL